MDYYNNAYPNKDRRRFIRIPFQKNISYRICYDKFSSEKVEGDSQNISANGILFKTKWPPPTMAILSVDVNVDRLREYLKAQNLEGEINIDTLYIQNGKLFGEVVRVREYPESGFYDVAVKLIHKKSGTPQKKSSIDVSELPQDIDDDTQPEGI